MTDLIERYLGAIARHLPEGQKTDVTAELRDVLLSQVEEEEERLGRPQTHEELEALLIRFGHPLTVSGRYRETQHLIGPEVFPFWWAAIKATLGVILGIWVVMTAFIIISGQHFAPGRDSSEGSLLGVLIFAFGAITLVCALIERFGKTAILQKWKPSRLPPPSGKTKSRFERIVEIGMSLIFILWWVGAVEFRNFLPDYRMSVELAPIWREMYVPVLAYAGYDMGANVLALLTPGAVILNRVASLVRNLFGLGVLGVIYQAGHWVDVSWDVWGPEVHDRVQANFDLGMRIGIAATLMVFLVLAAIDAWRIWQMVQARRGASAAT